MGICGGLMWWAYVVDLCGGHMWGVRLWWVRWSPSGLQSSFFVLGSGMMMIMVVKDQSPDHNSSWRNVCPGFARWAAVLTSGLYRFAGRTLRRPASITFSSSLNSEPLQSSQTDQHNWCCVGTFLFLFPPFTIFFPPTPSHL